MSLFVFIVKSFLSFFYQYFIKVIKFRIKLQDFLIVKKLLRWELCSESLTEIEIWRINRNKSDLFNLFGFKLLTQVFVRRAMAKSR